MDYGFVTPVEPVDGSAVELNPRTRAAG